MNWTKFVLDREIGIKTPFNSLVYYRLDDLRFNRRKIIQVPCPEVTEGPPKVLWFALGEKEWRYLSTAGHDGSIMVYDLQERDEQFSTEDRSVYLPKVQIDRNSPGCHSNMVTCVDWYPVDNGLIISGSLDNKVVVWDFSRQTPSRKGSKTKDVYKMDKAWTYPMEWSVWSVAMSKLEAHSLIAVSGMSHSIKICDIACGGSILSLYGHTSFVSKVVWSRNNEFQLYSGSKNGELKLWDIRRHGTVYDFDSNQTTGSRGASGGDRSDTAEAHRGVITDILPSPNGRQIVSAATDDSILLWDTETGRRELVHYPEAFNSSMRNRQMSMSDDGRLIFFPSGNVINVYDVESGELKTRLRGQIGTINCCLFNTQMQEIYAGSQTNVISVWSVEDEESDDDEDDWSD